MRIFKWSYYMPFKLSYPALFLSTLATIFTLGILALPVIKPAPVATKPVVKPAVTVPALPLIKTFTVNGITVHVANYDITTMNVDVIVNAANKALPWPAGGVCRAIYLAADPAKLNPWVKANVPVNANEHRIELGQAIASPSFDLAQYGIKHIIHTAGPDARIEEPVEAIYDAYANSLLLADSLNAQSIAFPAISIGIFECDKQEVAEYAIQAITDIAPTTNIKTIYLLSLDDEYFAICEQLLS